MSVNGFCMVYLRWVKQSDFVPKTWSSGMKKLRKLYGKIFSISCTVGCSDSIIYLNTIIILRTPTDSTANCCWGLISSQIHLQFNNCQERTGVGKIFRISLNCQLLAYSRNSVYTSYKNYFAHIPTMLMPI